MKSILHPNSPPAAGIPAGTQPVITVAQGLKWHCLTGSHGWLFTAKAPNWTDLSREPAAQTVKTNPVRQVFRVSYNNKTLYVKIYQCYSPLTRLKWLIQNPPAQTEFERLLLARSRNVPAPQPIAWAAGRVKGAWTAILITKALENQTTIDQLIWQQHPQNTPELDQYLKAAAAALAQMHCAGIEHRDLHPGNILLASDPNYKAWITDLQNCRIEQRGGHASADPGKRWRIKNLAVIVAALRTRLPDTQVKNFATAYLRAIQPNRPWQTVQQELYLGRLFHAADRHDRRIIAQRDRLCLRNTRYNSKIQLDRHWTGFVYTAAKLPQDDSAVSHLTFDLQQWKTALADPDHILNQGQNLKDPSRRNTVIQTTLEIAGRRLDVVIKRTKVRPGLMGLIETLYPCRAIRQWRRAHGLIARRIPTAWPLAALEHRPHGILTESYFICEVIPNCQNLKLMNMQSEPAIADRKTRRQAAQALGRLIAQLQQQRIRHRDCKASNILLQKQSNGSYRPYLVDLDGVTFSHLCLPHHRHQALVRLGTAAVELPGITIKDCLATLKSYLETLDLPQAQDRIAQNKLFHHLKDAINRRANQTAKKVLKYYPIKDWPFRNILIVKPSSLGDVARCLDILQALRQRYPQAYISWLIRPDCAGILPAPPALNEKIIFDRKRLGKMFYNPFALKDFFKLVFKLRRSGFDLVLDFQDLFRSGFLSFCTKAPLRIGYANNREFAGRFYNHRVTVPEEPEHVVDSYWRIVEPLHVKPGEIQTTANSVINTDRSALKTLSQIPLEKQKYLALLIGGTEPAKQWPPESFAELADSVNKRYHIQVVLLGAGKAEAQAAEQLCQHAKNSVINLVGKTDMKQLVDLLLNAKLVLGNDSGPLHIAAAYKVPVIGLYGPTNPVVVGPYGQIDSVVEAGKNVNRQGRYSKAPQHAMTNITVAEVLQAVERKCDFPPNQESTTVN
ncbi:MAG: lipopolysaccharide heptosyltransferase II [Sedimentisphaerales bacterium]|nr:lipopolysaccharide heptosyltransferase II [Sedimentisphaerales bacterium]